MDAKRIKIINGRVITPYRIMEGGTVLIVNGKIEAVSKGDIEAGDAQVIDAKGQYVSPGFIDIHVHGGGGHDFMDNTPEAFYEIARVHAQHGTTSMFPTTLTSEIEDLYETIDVYSKVVKTTYDGAQFLGLH